MAPKKKLAFLTISGSNAVPVPTPRHAWPEHPIVKDSFWGKALNEWVEASHMFEYSVRAPLVVGCHYTAKFTGRCFAIMTKEKVP